LLSIDAYKFPVCVNQASLNSVKIIIFHLMNNYTTSAIIFSLLCITTTTYSQTKPNTFVDYHVHLQDSATVQLGYRMLKAIGEEPKKTDSIVLNADTAIQRLNKAGFYGAWILSNAYWFGSPLTPIDNEYEQVKQQNNWTADEAARYPDRLKAFVSVNPLKPYALQEIERCADSKRFYGLKLHFANSKIDLTDTAQVAQLQKVFALANKKHLAMLVHFRSGQVWDGVANTQILLKQLMPFAKNTKVVIAHMAGWGGYDKPMDTALTLMAAYIHKNPYNNLNLEISAVLPLTLNEDYKPVTNSTDWNPITALKKRIEQIGSGHILFGTDWPLIDMDEYILLLKKELGKNIVQKILESKLSL